MASKKINKNLCIGIGVAVVVLIAIIVGVVFLIKNNGSGANDTQTTDDIGEVADVESAGPQGSSSLNIEVSVDYEDYESMKTFAQAVQNGELTGKTVQVDGIISHPANKYSIVERAEDGTTIGTEFIIEGIEEGDYPQDGDHVVITGEIVEKEPLYFIIKTSPQYVETVETASMLNGQASE